MGFFSKLFGGGAPKDRKPAASGSPPAPTPAPSEPEPEMQIPWKELTPDECRQRIEAGGVIVLDVRMPMEHQQRRIPGSMLLPVQSLMARIGQLDPKATYIVHCEHGMRSSDASAMLTQAGFPNVFEMAGGLAMYTGPTERGPVKPPA